MARSISELEKYLDREFGPIDNLVDQTERRSRVMLDEAPDAGLSDLKAVVGDSNIGKSGPTLPELKPQDYNAQGEGNWDRTRLFGAGVLDLGEMVVGGAEYGARQAGMNKTAAGLEDVRGGINEIREGILSGVSPEYLDRVGKEIMTLDPSRSLWRSGNPLEIADAIYGKFTRSLPSTLAVMLPAGRLFKAGHTAGALTYLGASEGGLSVGAIANNLTDEIKGMTNEQLLKESSRYAQIYQSVGGDEVEARQRFTAEAQGAAPLVGGAAVAAISLATGRLLKPVFDIEEAAKKGLTLPKRIGTGFIAEFPQEGSQGVSEQMAQNFAAKIYDENRPLMEGALEAFGQEGLIGGLTGGAVAGAFGARPGKPPGPPIPEPPDAMGMQQLNLPGFGPQQPGGASPLDQQRGPVIPDEEYDPKEVSDRIDPQLDLGPGYDLRSQRTYETRGGETRELPPDMQVKGRDISDETGFTMPGTTTAPTGYTVWTTDTKGKTAGKERNLKRFETEAEAKKYAKKLREEAKKEANKGKGWKVETAAGERVTRMEVDEQGQGQLPLRDRSPLRERVPGDRNIPAGAPFEATMPDSMDQPSAEPLADIEAQLADFENAGGRSAVYLSPEQRNAPRRIPKGAKVVPNWDGKGGRMIFKNAAAAKRGAELQRAVREGKLTWQEAIGQLTLSGSGKPVQGRFVVQVLDDKGNVARETMEPTLAKAQQTRRRWKKQGLRVRITSPEGAINRRQALMEEPLTTDREPVTKTSATEYQAGTEESGQMTLPGMEVTRQATTVGEGTTASAEVDERQFEIEDEIATRKTEQEEAAALAKQEEEQQAREEYERQQRFEEESQKEFDETITDEDLDSIVTRYIDAYELVETEDGRLEAVPFRQEYTDQEEANEAWNELNERNKAKLREFGLPESKKDFQKHLNETQRRVVDDPPEGQTPEEREAWAKKNRGKITESEFAEYKEYLNNLKDNMRGGNVQMEGSLELDILFEQAVRAAADRQPVVEQPYFDERPSDTRQQQVFDEEAAKQSTEATDDFTGKINRLQDPGEYSSKEEGRIFDAELDQELSKDEQSGEEGSTEAGDKSPTRFVRRRKRDAKGNPISETFVNEETKKKYKVPVYEYVEVGTGKVARESSVEKQARKDYGSTPGAKLKFIIRERGNQVNRKAEVRNVKDTKVVVDEKGKTTGTKPLTYEAKPVEETRQQKRERAEKAKEANKVLRKALNRAKRFIKRFETGGIFGRYRGKNYTKAKEHYKEFIKLAEALLNPRLYQASYTETYKAETREKSKHYVVYAGVKTESPYKTGEQLKLRPFGTTTSREAADKLAEQLKSEGVQNVQVKTEEGMVAGTPNTYQRVVVKTFNSKPEAEAFLKGKKNGQVNVVRTDTQSAGQVSTATEVAKVLDSATDGMDAKAFEKKFGTLSDKQERLMAKDLPSNRKETRAQKQAKVKKKSSERLSESRWRQIRTAWDNNEMYRELVAPVINKIANAALETYNRLQSGSGGNAVVYTPTDTEIRQIRSVLKAWRAPGTKLNPDIFADPLREALRNIGFTFDADGNVSGYEPPVSQETTDGIQMPGGQIFAPYGEGFIGPLPKPKPVKLESAELKAENREEYRELQERRRQAAKERQEKKEHPSTRRARTRKMNRAESERQKAPGSRRAEANERLELAEKREAVRLIEAVNAVVDRFKERVAHSKTRNEEIKREERRMVKALTDLGVWREGKVKNTGRIVIGGYVDKTIRLYGSRIGQKEGQITGKQAKELIAKNARIPIPRDVLPVWRRLTRRLKAGTIVVSSSGEASQLAEAEYRSVYGPMTDKLLEETDDIVDLFLENIDLADNTPQLDAAASEVGDMIRDKYSRQPINTVLDAIIRNLPENHFYTTLAKKLRSMGMDNIEIHYDWTNDKFVGRKKDSLGVYDSKTGRIYLNRRVMGERMSELSGAEAIHTILHETLHAATAAELRTNWKLRSHFFFLRQAAILEWKRRNGDKNMPYGLQLSKNEKGNWTPVDEFVAEVFASPELQIFLKSVPVTSSELTPMSTVWSAIKTAVIRLLGWGNVPKITNLFDAFMAPGDMVFASAGQRVSKGRDLNYGGDNFLRRTGEKFHAKLAQRDEIYRRVKDRAKNYKLRFSSFAMNLSTMEQFVDMFYKFFDITDADGNAYNPLSRYHKAFQERNGHASERMEIPTELSGKWTELEESNPDEALEMSQVMSEARLFHITATDPLDADTNAHLVSDEQKERHRVLHDRFKAMSPQAQKLYRDVRAYYKNAVKEQQLYLMQSGLRGVTGVTFTEEQLNSVESKADLDKMLEEHIEDEGRRDMVDTLWEMSRVPVREKGDWFPLMRYGDNVAYAEGEIGRETFEDRASARERRAEIAGTDPRLDVHFEQDEKTGKWHVITMQREMRMAETKSEIVEHWEEMRQKYPEGGPVKVYGPQLRQELDLSEGISSNAQLRSILTALKDDPHAAAAVKNFYLRNLAEQSMRKHELKSKDREGVNYDLQHRNLATYARQHSYYVSQLQYGWQMAEALSDMWEYAKKREGLDAYDLTKVAKHLKKRDAMGQDLPEVNSLVRAGVEGTHFFMLTSPSYWAINGTQPWMVSLPQMAGRYGYGNTFAMMNRTMRMISPILGKQALKTRLGMKALTDRELREESFNIINQLLEELKGQTSAAEFAEFSALIKKLRRQHIIDINVFTEMRELSQGKVGGAKGAWAGVVDASRVMAHLTEVNNRVLVSLTAYQLARNAGENAEDAAKYAGRITSQTQFNYSSQNKPPLFQSGGPLGMAAPLMFQFMQWPQHMYAQLIRNYMGMVEAGVMNKSEARTALLGLLGTHTAVGGVVGMTLQPIKWAIGTVLMAFGDDDEPYTLANALSGQTYDQLMSKVAADVFGTTLGTFFSKGIPAGLGIDLSVRMSMGTLYFIDLRGDDANSVIGSLMASFGGATLNQGVNFGRGLGYAMEGNYLRGIETASPKFARDVLKAVRYYREGLVNRQGDTVIDASEMSIAEVLAQSLGFTPTDISDFYDAQAAMKGAETFAKKRRERLLKDFRTADSGSERMNVLREIRGFNRSNRQEAIEPDTLWSTWEAKFKREFRYRRLGANIDEEKARFYREYGEPYRD